VESFGRTEVATEGFTLDACDPCLRICEAKAVTELFATRLAKNGNVLVPDSPLRGMAYRLFGRSVKMLLGLASRAIFGFESSSYPWQTFLFCSNM
jgi:hypothetical protein